MRQFVLFVRNLSLAKCITFTRAYFETIYNLIWGCRKQEQRNWMNFSHWLIRKRNLLQSPRSSWIFYGNSSTILGNDAMHLSHIMPSFSNSLKAKTWLLFLLFITILNSSGMLVLTLKLFVWIRMAMFCIFMLMLLPLLHGILITGFLAQVISIHLWL